jgi:chromo domain-containing protein 1
LVTDTPNKSTVFWYIAEGAAEYPMYGPPEGSSFGQITATRLLPQGHAFFLTPSFLIAEPGRAYALLDWFEKVLLKKAPGSWKLVCAYNIRKYLLDLAIEKSAERDELEAEYQGQARKDAIMEEKGLSYANCLLRFQVHDAVVKMLSRSGTNYYSDDDSSDIADEFTSPIIYADKFVNADDEQALVTWFAGWAMCKLDQFRKFTVVGTAPKSEKRAVRVKTVTSGPESPNLRERARSNPSEISMFKSDASSKPGIPKTGKIFRDLLPISPVESSNIGSAPPKVSESRPAPEGPASVELQRGISVVATLKPSASSSVSPAQALENSSSEFGIKGLASKLPVTFGPPISPQFPLAGHKVTVPSNSPVGGYAITAPNETSPASPPQDQDIEMSIENVSVSGHDPAAQRQGNAGPTSLDGAFIFSPPQFDGPGNKRPASSSSSRSSIQSDESGRPFVPKSFRSSGTIRPELAVKTGYISSEDQETYDAPHRRALGDVSNNSSSEFSHQGSHHIPVEGATQQDSDMMELDSPVLGESASTSAGEMEKGEILTKEIKYEATTTWYEKWYKKGKGWEHVYVESWEKAWKYLGVKEDVTGGQ